MTEAEFRKRTGNNIAYYRKINGMTQSALAEKLNYSDKAVSKWERGESIPDAFVLYEISGLFSCSLNDITGETPGEEEKGNAVIEKVRQRRFKRGMVTALSVGLCWLVFSVIFFIAQMIANSLWGQDNNQLWIIFLYGIPVTFILTLIFSALWGRLWQQALSVSGILWGTVASVLTTFHVFAFASKSGKYLLIAAVIFQIIIIMWYALKMRMNKNK